jgi:hypothetical protein
VAETTVKEFYAAGFDALVKRWDKMMVEEISRNKCFSPVQISHVLCFKSICDLLTVSPSYHTVKYDNRPHTDF